MLRIITCIIGFVLFIFNISFADNLYKVKISSSLEATRLRQCHVHGIVRLSDGFIVVANNQAVDRLAQSGLNTELIASDISLDKICFERTYRSDSAANRPLLFDGSGVRISRLLDQTAEEIISKGEPIIQISDTVTIEYRQSRSSAALMLERLSQLSIPLDSIISRISKDSLISTLRFLESLPPRVVGSVSMRQTRDWIVARLRAYGVDSIAIDSFGAINGTGFQPGWNVIGYKFGKQYPNLRIVIEAHSDAVASCPGADDDGSGTVATLEIARALSGIETDMTVVFALCDGEEAGLWGSKYYAHQCKARGDSVVYMIALDMIGEITNTDTVIAYVNPPLECSQLFSRLSDSLLNLITEIQPMIICDAYPWDQGGFEAAFIEEKNFSPQYHRLNDSTTYIDFDYMMRVTQTALATTYTISQTAWPEPTLDFYFSSGLPPVAHSSSPVSFDVEIISVNNGVLQVGSVKLVYKGEDGNRKEVPLVSLGSGLYRVTLPSLDCGERVLFWVQANEITNGTVYDCDTLWPHLTYGATNTEKIFEDNFETDKGWTVQTQCYQNRGAWERGFPAGAGFRNEAVLDFDNSGQCYQTGNRFYQQIHWVLMGHTILTSPAINVHGANALIHFALLYSNSSNNQTHTYTPYEDSLFVFIRNYSSPYGNLVFTLGPTYRADGGWFEYTFRAGDFIATDSNFQVMIIAEDIDNYSIVEAAIDDFWVMKFDCDQQEFCCNGTTGDVNLTGFVDIEDLTALVMYLTGGNYVIQCFNEANIDRDGIVDITDLSVLVDYLTSGEYVLPNCP